jgi:anthranilate phosphoribosyltransferase
MVNAMFDLTRLTDPKAQQTAFLNLMGMPLLDGFANVFAVQAQYLQRVELLMQEALRRRRAGCLAAQELVDKLRAAREPSEVVQAQVEWATGAMQRLMQDAALWNTGAAMLASEAARKQDEAAASAPASVSSRVKVPA